MTVENSVVSEVRRLTDSECQEIGVPVDNLGNPRCLVLSSGSLLFPVSDRAMNSAGGWRGDTDNMKSLEGKTIENVAPMSDKYMRYLEWDNQVGNKPVVLEFSDGRKIYTAKDSEGNGAGLLFEYDNGQTYEVVFN